MDKKDLDCKQFEKQLFSTQKTENLGILAGRIGHDLNNLLTVIMGNIEILKFLPSIAGNPPQEISFISDAAAKAAELTHRMLRLSGRAASQSAFMNLNAIIEEYLPILWLALPKSIPIQTELSPDLPEIQIIRADIEQVLLNLVINSGEALQDKSGKVTISTGIKNMKAAEFAQSVLDEKPAAGKYIYFTVSDTGPGIESSVKDRVFDPFFTTKPQGRGLGLTVVQCIIRKYHGALFLEAPHGKATKITIMLPLLQPDSGESHEALQSIFKKDSGKRLSGTLIVADDEPIVLRILVKILQSTGLSILPAKNGLEVRLSIANLVTI